MATTSVKIVDKGLKALLDRVGKAAVKKTLTVGVHDDAGGGAHGGGTVIDVATKNEFGLGVPQRSFIGAWADERRAMHEDHLVKLGEALVKGTVKDVKFGLAQLGEVYVGEVQSRIAGGIAPPNAPSTIARKGSSTPLIDTGVLRSSIAAKVDGQGSSKIIAAAAPKKPKKAKKAKKSKLVASLRKKIKRLRKQFRKLKLKAKLKSASRKIQAKLRSAKRDLKRAKRQFQRRTKQALRSVRRVQREANRAYKRGKRSVFRSYKQANRSITRASKALRRSANRTYRSTSRALKRTFRGSRRRRR